MFSDVQRVSDLAKQFHHLYSFHVKQWNSDSCTFHSHLEGRAAGVFAMDKQNFARVVDESLHNLRWKLLDAFPEIQAGCDSLQLGTSSASPNNFAHLTPMVKDSPKDSPSPSRRQSLAHTISPATWSWRWTLFSHWFIENLRIYHHLPSEDSDDLASSIIIYHQKIVLNIYHDLPRSTISFFFEMAFWIPTSKADSMQSQFLRMEQEEIDTPRHRHPELVPAFQAWGFHSDGGAH